MIAPEAFVSVASEVMDELVGVAPTFPQQFTASALQNGVITRLNFAPETGEWMLHLAQDGQSDPPFELSDLLRVTACPESTWRPLLSVVAKDVDAARRVLLSASEAVRTFGSSYLLGDDQAFSTARQDRSERAAAYTASVNQAPAIRRANEAWSAGDMNQVVDSLSPFRDDLPPNQARRLEFAERKRYEGDSRE